MSRPIKSPSDKRTAKRHLPLFGIVSVFNSLGLSRDLVYLAIALILLARFFVGLAFGRRLLQA